MNVEFSVATSGTDSIPTKPYNIVNRIGTSISTLYEKISFSDKVLGIRSPLSTRDKVNLTKNKLVWIKHDNGNRLQPIFYFILLKMEFLTIFAFFDIYNSLIIKLLGKSIGFF